MTAKDAIKISLATNLNILKMLVGDLSDADLFVRPAAGANHAAWQLGHLIAAEPYLLAEIPKSDYSVLPADFSKPYGKDGASLDGPDGFLTRQKYVDLYDQVRARTLAALDALPDADLDKPTQGTMAPVAPTLGALYLLTANHTLMHAGQITVIRRKLGKPVLF